MPWNKIKPTRKFGARPAITSPRVRRNPSAPGNAILALPQGGAFKPEQRFSVYSDGNGKIAFMPAENGEYRTHKNAPHESAVKCSIPSDYAGRIPFGTTEVSIIEDGGMHVLDLSQLGAA